ALSSLSTSASVRYSRVRRSALGGRLGVTVRFTGAGVTGLRVDFATDLTPPARLTVRIILQLRTVRNDGRSVSVMPTHAGSPFASRWLLRRRQKLYRLVGWCRFSVDAF